MRAATMTLASTDKVFEIPVSLTYRQNEGVSLQRGAPMTEQWLKCRVYKGMFSDELAVKVSSLKGNDTSVFVPKAAVEGVVDDEGKVRVRVFREGKTAWAVLPTETRTTIPVREADLMPA
jgi:hypothetical protein